MSPSQILALLSGIFAVTAFGIYLWTGAPGSGLLLLAALIFAGCAIEAQDDDPPADSVLTGMA